MPVRERDQRRHRKGRRGTINQIGAQGQQLLKSAPVYIDARQADPNSSYVQNLGTLGEIADFKIGSVGRAEIRPGLVGGNHLRLPATINNYASTPDIAAHTMAGDFSIEAKVALDDWTPAANNMILSKWFGGTNQQSFIFYVVAGGALRLQTSTDGALNTSATSSASPTVTDGGILYLRVERRGSDGRVQFFTSTDGSTYTQLGTNQVASTGALFDSTAALLVGANDGGGGNPFGGRVYYTRLYTGLLSAGGTALIADFDPSRAAIGATSFTASTGEVWTINQTSAADTNDPTYLPRDSLGTYAYFPGGSNANSIACPTAAALNVTDLDVRALVNLDDWTPAVDGTFMGRDSADPNRAWWFGIRGAGATLGKLFLTWFPTGSLASRIDVVSSIAVPVSDGTPLWVRCTLDVDNGAAGYTATFYTSPATDGVNWTMLGTQTIGGATTNLPAVSAALNTSGAANQNLVGRLYRAIMMDGINGSIIRDCNVAYSVEPHTSFVATTGETWTISRVGAGKKLALVDRSMWLLGTDDYLVQLVDINALDAGVGVHSPMAATRMYGTQAAAGVLFAKRDSNSAVEGAWALITNLGASSGRYFGTDGVNSVNITGGAFRDGVTRLITGVLSARAVGGANAYSGTNLVATGDSSLVGSVSNSMPMTVGAQFATPPTINAFTDGEFMMCAYFDRILTTAEMGLVCNYLGVPQ